VTAERRFADVMRTPISMSVESGEQLGAQGQSTVFALQTTVPNLTVDQLGPAENDISIRGLGVAAGTRSASIAPGVVVFHDGLAAPETIGLGASLPFYDIRDVEVLRGPQGTLVGQSSTGGAIEINSRDPSLDSRVSGYVESQLGSYTDVKLDGAVNLPVSTTLAVRLAFSQETQHSFYYDEAANPNPATGTSTVTDPGSISNHNYRLGILWKPTSSFRALLKASYNLASFGGDPEPANQRPFYNTVTGATGYSPYYASSTHRPFVINPYISALTDDDMFDSYSLDLELTLPDQMVLRSLSGFQNSYQKYYDVLSGTSLQSGTRFDTVEPDRYWSEELSLLSPSYWRVSFMTGAYIFYRATPLRSVITNTLPPYSPANPSVSEMPFQNTFDRNGAIFGTVSFNATDELQLELGARQNWDSNYQRGLNLVRTPSPPLPAPMTTTHITSNNFYDSRPTGKVGVNWTVAHGQFVYGFWAHGYRAGGVSSNGINFEPEQVDDYELGWKGELLDDHMRVELGGFYMRYLHMQQQLFSTLGVGSQIVNLTGTTTIKGLELTEANTWRHFETSVSVGYTLSNLGSTTAVASYELPANVLAGVPQCPAGGVAGPLCFDFKPYQMTLSGESMPLSPKLSAAASMRYRFSIESGRAELTPEIRYSYVGRQYASIFEIPYYELPAISLWNASITYTRGSWLAEAYTTNLANTLYLAGNSGSSIYYGPPRQFGIRVTRSF
jgi:iron complex outermembrane receptor protein